MSNQEIGPRGEALKQAIRRLAEELRRKIEERQAGVGTFADHVLLAFIAHLERHDTGGPWEEQAGEAGSVERAAFDRLRQLIDRRAQGRFVEYEERLGIGAEDRSEVGYFDMVMSQGAADCQQWKGRPLFKTVYDVSLYPMLLWELKPATIVELGSGSGASALWMADLTAAFAMTPHIYSVDLRPPDAQHERVTFLEGDCEAIESALRAELLAAAPHPWLIVEDAHVNVYGVLRYLHPFVQPGDYLVVEDSAGKQDELRHFLTRYRGSYKVDTYYTDFFGRNATCAQDSILVRLKPDAPDDGQ